MPFYFRAFPCGSRYPLYLFCLMRTKKDVAAIPNAAVNTFLVKQNPHREIGQIKVNAQLN